MARGISSEREFEDAEEKPRSGEKRYSKRVWEAARDKAKIKGGEPEQYLDEIEQALRQPREPRAYADDDLVHAGYRLTRPYDYTDVNGQLLYQSLRYEHPAVPHAKQFRQRRRGKDGKWYADAGLIKVLYRWPDVARRKNEPVYFVEGEKDADNLMSLGLLTTTVAGQHWSAEAAKALKGRDVIIIGDNDDAGREHARKAAEALRGFATSVRMLDLPGLRRTEDVSDWLEAGHTKDELLGLAKCARSSGVRATAVGLIQPASVPPRRWIYEPHYIRQFVSLLISTGGIGKSSLAIVEALAMVSGKPLLRVKPLKPGGERLRVWYWNGEDPLEELQRRFAAAMKHYKLTTDDVGEDRLFINSGRSQPIVIAEEDKRLVRLNSAVVTELIDTIRSNRIDVIIVDPFVTTHRVNENDNGAIDLVVKTWNRIAEETNSAVMLVHHSRKPNGGELTVDDTRGASALLAAARSARTINTMTSKEAQEAEVEEHRRRSYFSVYMGKANLSLPADRKEWFCIESVDLVNAFPFGDSVGVVTPWTFPVVEKPKVTEATIRRACESIKAGGPWREDQRAKNEPWVGRPIAAVLNLDPDRQKHKKLLVEIIKDWIKRGIVRIVERQDGHREPRRYVEVSEPAAPKARPSAESPGPSSAAEPATAAAEEERM